MNRIAQIASPVRFTVVIACGIAVAAYVLGCKNGPQQASNTKRHKTPSELLAKRHVSQSHPRFDMASSRSSGGDQKVRRETKSTASYRPQPDDNNPFLLLKRSLKRHHGDPFLELQKQQAAKSDGGKNSGSQQQNPIVPASGRKENGGSTPANPFDIIKQNRTVHQKPFPQRSRQQVAALPNAKNSEVDIPNLDTNPNHFANNFDRGMANLRKQVASEPTQTPPVVRRTPGGNPFAKYEHNLKTSEQSTTTVKRPAEPFGRVRITALPAAEPKQPEWNGELPVTPTKLTRTRKPVGPTITAKPPTTRTLSQGDPSMIVDSKRLTGVPLRSNPIAPVFKNPPAASPEDLDIKIIPRRTSSPAIMRPQKPGDAGPVTDHRSPRNDSKVVTASAVRSDVHKSASTNPSEPLTLDQLTGDKTASPMEWVAKSELASPAPVAVPKTRKAAPPMPVELPAPLKAGQPQTASSTDEQNDNSAATHSDDDVAAMAPPGVSGSGESEGWSATAVATVVMLLLLVLLAAFRHRRRIVRI